MTYERQPYEQPYLDPEDTDALTGLANRRWLNDNLPLFSALPAEFGLHFLDLDGLKETNDTLGHEAGDALIQRAGSTISKYGIAVHLSGDEFVLITNSKTQEELTAVAAEVQDELTINNAPASIGSALHTEAEDASKILKNADSAMYTNKMQRKLESYSLEQQAVIQLIGELATKADIRLRDVPSMLDAMLKSPEN